MEKFIEKYKYVIHEDDSSLEDIKSSFDFGDEEANAEYLQKFIDEELFSFAVIKYKECECCQQWIFVDSLSGIHRGTTASRM